MDRDSELAYVCRCGAQFTRGGGDGSQGEAAYLSHIGFDTGIFGQPKQSRNGCPQMVDLFHVGARVFAWYGRHRAQIQNMELNAHPDAEVQRLTAITESLRGSALGFQAATDTLNAIVAHLRATMPEELTGQGVDTIVIRLLQRLAKKEATS